MKQALSLGLGALALAAASLAPAQSLDALADDAKTPGDVTTYGMGWSLQRHSALKQITPANVKKLVPVWNLSLDNSTNASNQPLLVDGTMYVATHTHTIAVDPLTGRQKWKTAIELPADIAGYLCCGIHTRGMAALDGVLYRTTIDAQVLAIAMADGKVLWKQKAADYKEGYSMTHAPLIAGGVLITGISGGEYGSRGFLKGWDLKTGAEKWHRWTTAAPGEPGGDTWKPDAYKTGGAPTWLTGSYDPELGLVYWGTGNGGPWNSASRGGGDSLYIGSVLAIKPATGEIVWHYQFSPGDPYDYDGVNELVLADLPIGGTTRKVLMQANRNGFFYVLDRTNGKFISGTQFARKVNWASGIGADGRPIDTPMTQTVKKTEEMKDFIEVWPSAFGGKNWMPMSYDPVRKLVYLNTVDLGMKVKYVKQERAPGPNWYLGLELGGFVGPEDGNRGALIAWDPAAGKAVWRAPNKSPYWSGVLSTDSGVVFTGSQTGAFMAFDAKNGKKLWSFQTGSGISGLPITWEKNGKQYVTVTSGSAHVYGALAGDPDTANIPAGGSVWTFALSK